MQSFVNQSICAFSFLGSVAGAWAVQKRPANPGLATDSNIWVRLPWRQMSIYWVLYHIDTFMWLMWSNRVASFVTSRFSSGTKARGRALARFRNFNFFISWWSAPRPPWLNKYLLTSCSTSCAFALLRWWACPSLVWSDSLVMCVASGGQGGSKSRPKWPFGQVPRIGTRGWIHRWIGGESSIVVSGLNNISANPAFSSFHGSWRIRLYYISVL